MMSIKYPNSKKFVSKEHEQMIVSDINIIYQVINSRNENQNKIENKSATKNKLKLQSIRPGGIRFKPFQIKLSSSQNPQNQEQFLEFSQKFKDLCYNELIFVLCRKRVYSEFILQYLNQKYNSNNLNKLGWKLVNSYEDLIKSKKQPQITLLSHILQGWFQLIGKQDVFADTVEILTQNISKNWKSNHIKTQKKNQRQQQNAYIQPIFKTQPNINIEDNKIQYFQELEVKKTKIYQSTRNILDKLSLLKNQMEQCQAGMNMAKNNEQKVIQHSNNYYHKKIQYNRLKQKYRTKTISKSQVAKTSLKGDKQAKNVDQIKENSNYNIKEEEQQSESNQNEQIVDSKTNIGVQRVSEGQKILYEKGQADTGQRNAVLTVKESPSSKRQQNSKKNESSSLNIGQCQYSQQRKFSPKQLQKLINILDMIKKNMQRDRRLRQLTGIDTEQKQLRTSLVPVIQSKRSTPLQSQFMIYNGDLLYSSKQILFQKYIRRIFNFYVLQQNSDQFHLKDSLSAGGDGGIESSSLIFSAKNKQNQARRRFHTLGNDPTSRPNDPINRSSIQADYMNANRKISLNPQNDTNCNHAYRRLSLNSRRQINQLAIHQNSLKRNLTRSPFKIHQINAQPLMSIKSYSKFIRQFQLTSERLSLSEVLALFKLKCKNKRSVTYNQFLQLFESMHRHECQKLDIQFQPKLFDCYLRKQILCWQKINSVLRLKPAQISINRDRMGLGNSLDVKTNNPSDASSGYKYSVTGHSGKLSQQIQQNLKASKKPFTRMPCLSLNKKITPTPSILPKTKIQLKVQSILHQRQIQNIKRSRQLQEVYQSLDICRASAQYSEQLAQKAYRPKQTQSSYFKLYGTSSNRKKYLNQRKKGRIKPNQFSRGLDICEKSGQTKKLLNNKVNTREGYKQNISKFVQPAQRNASRNRVQRFDNQTQQDSSLRMRNNHKNQMLELEKIIGIISSDDQDYNRNYEEDSPFDLEQQDRRQPANNKNNYLLNADYETHQHIDTPMTRVYPGRNSTTKKSQDHHFAHHPNTDELVTSNRQQNYPAVNNRKQQSS